ncbi:hypothetical protein D5018_04295 [Parashewanella curva]|uniref:Uncharacterized protein n=1 Tax=Parashewanella curva TaxID=2338552 RepID=A0A3L8Q1C0_9GAMM|nr:hypothetical protein [Parashewanella curva]RLV60869.1 hypothetical protein D5018_04295 [Parashewanella curva]
MSVTQVLKIFALWFFIAIIPITLLFGFSPMAGGSLLLVLVSLMFVVIGAPIQIFLTWRNPSRAMLFQFIYSFLIIIVITLLAASTGKFNVT